MKYKSLDIEPFILQDIVFGVREREERKEGSSGNMSKAVGQTKKIGLNLRAGQTFGILGWTHERDESLMAFLILEAQVIVGKDKHGANFFKGKIQTRSKARNVPIEWENYGQLEVQVGSIKEAWKQR